MTRTASRHARDRDLFEDAPRMGPYESTYDVRRGYQEPLRPSVARGEEETLFFRGRDEDEAERPRTSRRIRRGR